MDEIVDNWKRVSILLSDGIERVIVLYKSKLAVLILYEEDWGSDG